MRKFLLALLLSTYLLAPTAGMAANVGFVPSTGLWFSRDSFYPKETIRIYTVVINNEYASLDGVVAFYDNSDIIDKVEVKGIPKEGAKLLRVFWEPTEGAHAVSARFIKAVATDEKGIKKELDIQTITSIAGAPLTMASGSVTPVVQNDPQKAADQLASVGATIPTAQTSAQTVSEVQLIVKREGDKLALTPSQNSIYMEQDTNQTGAVSVAGVRISLAPSTTPSNLSEDAFAKNREILQKAEAVAGTVTTTAGKLEAAYDKTKAAVEKGKEAYAEGQKQLSKVQPYLKKLEPYWNRLSNNNEPKRVAIIVAVTLVVIWMIKRAIKPKFYRDYGAYRR